MPYDPVDELGLHCPGGGDFYICQDSSTRFIGCCEVNPCAGALDGFCPGNSLRPAGFGLDKYDEIPPQQCFPGNAGYWYTCLNGPAFMGCCRSNPCDNEGVCPDEDLVDAALSDDESSAAAFLTTPTPTSTSSSSSSRISSASTPSSSSSSDESTSSQTSASATSTQDPSSSSSTSHDTLPPIGALVGGIIGGLVILCLVAFIFYYRRRKRRRAELTAVPTSDEDTMIATSSSSSPPPPWSPYHDSSRNTSLKAPPPGSPYSPPPTGTHLRSPRHHGHHERRKSLSKSFISIMGLNRLSSSARRPLVASNDNDDPAAAAGDWASMAHAHGGSTSLPPVAELESTPPGGLLVRGRENDVVYYEVEGSVPERHDVRNTPG